MYINIPVLEYSEIINGTVDIVYSPIGVSEIKFSTITINVLHNKFQYTTTSTKILTKKRINKIISGSCSTKLERKIIKLIQFFEITYGITL